jgi:hypothetical protein
MVREIVTLVCATIVIDGVVLAAPVQIERVLVALDSVDTDGAEIIETTGESVS